MGNNNLPSLEDAIKLAVDAHAGQQRLEGSPYIVHPLRVMLRFDTWVFQVVAVLHDVVEDTPVTLEQLEELGYPKKVIKAIDALTRREEETYMDFIARACENDIARLVKLADIQDNLEPETYPSMAQRYRKAIAYIKQACEEAKVVNDFFKMMI